MHEITLSNGACRWLAIYLNQPQIFTTTAQIYLVGILVASHLDEAANLEKEIADDSSKFTEWAKVPHEEFEISEAQRDAIKHGINELGKKGLLSPNKWTIELLETFGLKP
jgi:hypothetical protein